MTTWKVPSSSTGFTAKFPIKWPEFLNPPRIYQISQDLFLIYTSLSNDLWQISMAFDLVNTPLCWKTSLTHCHQPLGIWMEFTWTCQLIVQEWFLKNNTTLTKKTDFHFGGAQFLYLFLTFWNLRWYIMKCLEYWK